MPTSHCVWPSAWRRRRRAHRIRSVRAPHRLIRFVARRTGRLRCNAALDSSPLRQPTGPHTTNVVGDARMFTPSPPGAARHTLFAHRLPDAHVPGALLDVRGIMSRDDELRTFFESYGRALSSSNLGQIAAAWQVPAIVVDDRGVIAVTSTEQIETFFDGAAQLYRDQGIASTTPEIARAEWLSERMVEARVCWTRWSSAHEARGVETSQYVLRLDEAERPRIRVAMMLPPIAS